MTKNWLSADPSNPRCPVCSKQVNLGSFYNRKKSATCKNCGTRHVVHGRKLNGAWAMPVVLGALPASFTEWPITVKVSIFSVGLIVGLFFAAKSNAGIYLSPVAENTTSGQGEP